MDPTRTAPVANLKRIRQAGARGVISKRVDAFRDRALPAVIHRLWIDVNSAAASSPFSSGATEIWPRRSLPQPLWKTCAGRNDPGTDPGEKKFRSIAETTATTYSATTKLYCVCKRAHVSARR